MEGLEGRPARGVGVEEGVDVKGVRCLVIPFFDCLTGFTCGRRRHAVRLPFNNSFATTS
jgi:hypothetical protein